MDKSKLKEALSQESPMTEDEVRVSVERMLYGEQPVFPPLKDGATDLEFLEWLEGDVWRQQRRGLECHRMGNYYTERREITVDELKRFKRTVRRLQLIVEPVNACMGFNFGVNVYRGPSYPGLPPEPVVSITGHHLGTPFEKTWKILSPLSHSPENEARLRLYGFEPLREKSCYDY